MYINILQDGAGMEHNQNQRFQKMRDTCDKYLTWWTQIQIERGGYFKGLEAERNAGMVLLMKLGTNWVQHRQFSQV